MYFTVKLIQLSAGNITFKHQVSRVKLELEMSWTENIIALVTHKPSTQCSTPAISNRVTPLHIICSMLWNCQFKLQVAFYSTFSRDSGTCKSKERLWSPLNCSLCKDSCSSFCTAPQTLRRPWLGPARFFHLICHQLRSRQALDTIPVNHCPLQCKTKRGAHASVFTVCVSVA